MTFSVLCTYDSFDMFFFFFFKQKTAYEMLRSLVGSEMCIRDRYQRRVRESGESKMAKLYFRYGTVSSAKTLALLACAHTYEVQGNKVVVIKPDFDVRFGKTKVASRAGLSREADLLVKPDTVLPAALFEGCQCVLVDEAQFMSTFMIDQLREVATARGVPVICYGLRNDFRSSLFDGSKRLFELADSIEEVKTTCAFCNKKGVFNLKSVDGNPTISGDKICLGAEELYLPACPRHFYDKISLSTTELGCYLKKLQDGVDVCAEEGTAIQPPAKPDAQRETPLKRARSEADSGAFTTQKPAKAPTVERKDVEQMPSMPVVASVE
eukprot:TRINITY_DN55835_c0_g1_i1.p1 TRINITY_DN55835_c0_g1~~TRINITY_DN55835_c0_g1_i1.p1  ORF type:complete len:324 (-),score=108.10 TRINITY_DN55835_c0_g1_i1:236-1207(-)